MLVPVRVLEGGEVAATIITTVLGVADCVVVLEVVEAGTT